PGLVFGAVAGGQTVALSAALTNTGSNACVVGSLALSDDTPADFKLRGGPLAGVIVPGGQRLVATVELTAPGTASPGAHFDGSLVLTVNSTSQPIQSIGLSGVAAQPCLLALPSSLDFGKAPPGCLTLDRIVTVT